ncbi:MAG: response regulator [Phycisphaerae bacterium]|nr:response regulator [Phycisphaerae bacterium]
MSVPLPMDNRSRTSILVVDDHEPNVELIAAYLEDLNLPVRTASDGIEALRAIEADPPGVVLLDIMMPRMSGFQVCRKIKADPRTRNIRVIMLTALNEVSDVEKATESGADDYLTKPVTKADLLARLKPHLPPEC